MRNQSETECSTVQYLHSDDKCRRRSQAVQHSIDGSSRNQTSANATTGKLLLVRIQGVETRNI